MKIINLILALSLFLMVGCKDNTTEPNDNNSQNDTENTDNGNEDINYNALYNTESVSNNSNGTPKIGDFAPNFVVTAKEGKEITLNDLKGKVVLIKFWRTNCSSCRNSIPKLVEKKSRINNKDFIVLAISLDKAFNHSDKKVQDFIYDYKMNDWLNVLDGTTYETSIASLYNVEFTPYSLLLSKKGKILKTYVHTDNDFVEKVEKELGK